jgi:uncharacterized protein YbjT (DUF2867 family)
MHVTLENGTQFEIRAMSRRQYRQLVAAEAEAKERPGAVDDLHDTLLAEVYGEALSEIVSSNRDFLAVLRATIGWSVGASEEALGNSPRSGPGAKTLTD